MDWLDFVALVAIPAFGGLLLLHLRHRSEVAEQNREQTAATVAVAAELAAYKLEVAHRYASQGYLKDVEQRLTDYLEKIEKKLDKMIDARGEGR